MVYVDIERCAGCGICADACPVGAISLVGGTAKVDQERCTDCEACVEVCPNGAILAVREPVEEQAAVPSVRPAPEVIRAQPQPPPVSLPSRAWPAVSAATAALAHLGRVLRPLCLQSKGLNIAPRLADYLLCALDRRLSRRQASPTVGTSGGMSPASGGGGRRPSTGSGRGRRRRQGKSWRGRRGR